MIDIQFSTRIFEEDGMYVAHTPELDVSSCGVTVVEAKEHLLEAVRLFLEEADRMGTLGQILDEAGFTRRAEHIAPPEVVNQNVKIPLPFLHA